MHTVPFFNSVSYSDSIGFSVYAFEGVGIIMPVQDIARNPRSFRIILLFVIIAVAILYGVFGLFCIISWGDQIKTALITDKLPDGGVVYLVKILFAINLVFSFPLVIHPAHIIVENILY